MPPEPLPWDRKGEFFRDRKHGNGHGYGYGYDHGYVHHHGNGISGGGGRWRDSSSSSLPFAGSRYNSEFSPRWGFPSSDFRRPPGHIKQGGWHMYSEDSLHGYQTPRSGEHFLDDDRFRSSGPRGDGRYGRMFRENRNGFGQRDWRNHSWENNHHYSGPASTPGRLHNVNDQRSVGDSSGRPLHLNSDPNDQSPPKNKPDKTVDNDGSSTGQKDDKEKPLEGLDWKPLKWSRLGSLTSRGSGLSHSSSSSKNTGGESTEVKCELPPKRVTPVQSPSMEAGACAPTCVSSEETASRKKPRLGWGEGLAKFEKKKVDSPEEDFNRADNATSVCDAEPTHPLTAKLTDKSPKITGFSDSSSPASPSSFACSFSSGLEQKTCGKVRAVDANNFCMLSMPVPEVQPEGVQFCLEKLNLDSVNNLSSLLSEVLQVDDQCSVDSGFMRSSAFNKLLLWKGDLSKTLELTETEIDSLEIELLKADFGQGCPCPGSSSHSPVIDQNGFPRPPLLDVISSGNIVGDTCEYASGTCVESKDADVDSPGTATSKFVELSPLQKPATAPLTDSGFDETSKSRWGKLLPCVYEVATVGTSGQGDDGNDTSDDNALAVAEVSGVCDKKKDSICDIILASNKEIAAEASAIFTKLVTCHDHGTVSLQAIRPADLTIKDKFLKRKQNLRLKEKVMSLKYRALHRLWKEDLRLLSLKGPRVKPQKKLDFTSRTMQISGQKHRSSIRSRCASPACSLSFVPTTESLNFTQKLISDSEVKICRNSLKMPAMILEEKEKMSLRFLSSNGLVEDPLAVEKERSLINPWTMEEKEIFVEKLSSFGKDFSKIASFLDHKTTADCIEYYYKNRMSKIFEKTKQLDVKKQYMVTSDKKISREINAASLDILGAASVIAAQVDQAAETSKLLSGKSSNRKTRRLDGFIEASNKFYLPEDERETAAADVLAGICCSLSSEAMSSCISSSIDPGEGNLEWKHQKVGSSARWRLIPEVPQFDDDNYSDESCDEMDPVDWTNDEKSLFVQAFSSHGKDFLTISQFIRTKTKDQCRVFFSKARKCLGLDTLHPGSCSGGILGSNDLNEGGSGIEDAGVVETDSVACSDKSGSRMDEDVPHLNEDVSMPDASFTDLNASEEKCGTDVLLNYKEPDAEPEVVCPVVNPADSDLGSGWVVDVQDKRPAGAQRADEGSLITQDNTPVDVAIGVSNGFSLQVLGVVCPASVSEATNIKAVSICHDEEPRIPIAPIEPGKFQDGQRHCIEYELQNPHRGNFSCNEVEASVDLKYFPLDLSVKADTNDVVIHKAVSESKFSSFQECYFRKCSRLASQNALTELPLLQKKECRTNGVSSSSEIDKSGSSCDVKLFGKILSKQSSVDKPTSSVQQHDKKAKHNPSCTRKSSTKTICQAEISRHDQNGFVGLENVPIKSYGYWDGTKIQTGFPPLSESAQLLAKYPAAFGNYSSTLSRAEPQPVQAAVNSNKCNINGPSLFSPRDYSSSNAGSVIDYHSFRDQDGTQPFTLDVKQRQDPFPEVPRNGFEATLSSLQAQQNGLVNLNVVQGDIPYMGISDPVAALRLHYSGQQFGGAVHASNRDSWRGQGDVGR